MYPPLQAIGSSCHWCHQLGDSLFTVGHRNTFYKSKVPSSLSSLSDDTGGSGAVVFDGGGPQGQPP